MMRLPAALSWLLLLPVVGLEVLGVGCSSDDPTSPNAAATAAGSGGGARATGSGGSSAFNWMSGSAGAATTSTGTGGTNSIGSGGQNTSTGGSGTGGSMGTPGACTAIFCEDFESGTLDEALWTQHSDHGSIAVQSDKVSHGQKAAHFHMNAGKSNAYISEKKTYPELDREAFGRMYFRLEPKGPPSHTVFVSGGAMDNTAHLELANYDGGWQFTFLEPQQRGKRRWRREISRERMGVCGMALRR